MPACSLSHQAAVHCRCAAVPGSYQIHQHLAPLPPLRNPTGFAEASPWQLGGQPMLHAAAAALCIRADRVRSSSSYEPQDHIGRSLGA